MLQTSFPGKLPDPEGSQIADPYIYDVLHFQVLLNTRVEGNGLEPWNLQFGRCWEDLCSKHYSLCLFSKVAAMSGGPLRRSRGEMDSKVWPDPLVLTFGSCGQLRMATPGLTSTISRLG